MMRLTIKIYGEYKAGQKHYYTAKVVDAEGLGSIPYIGVTGDGDNEMDAFYKLAENMVKNPPTQAEWTEKLADWNEQCLDWRKRYELDSVQGAQMEEAVI